MADTTGTTGTYVLSTDPFFSLLANVQDVKTKVSDGIFEDYKMQVEQSNDINNRAMQVALSNKKAFAGLKAAATASVLQTMIAASGSAAAASRGASESQRTIMEQGEISRDIVNGINTQNLNTALININTELSGVNGLYGGLGLAYGGAVSAYQSVNVNTAVNSLGSAVSSQRVINTGVMTGTNQVSTSTNIG